MAWIVLLTGMVGLIASRALLAVGLDSMALRYPAAVGVTYPVFLLFLWFWVQVRSDIHHLDLPSSDSYGRTTSIDAPQGGGHFGGGGANGDWPKSADMDTSSKESPDPLYEAMDAAVESDEFAIPLVAIAFFAALFLSSLWIIWSAPALFAELLLDSFLSLGLYRHLRRLDSPHWLETAARRTARPFLLTAMMPAACGWGMAEYAPGAATLADVVHFAQVK